MEMKVGLTFACLNLKKLAKMKWKYTSVFSDLSTFIEKNTVEMKMSRKMVLGW